MPHGGRTPCPPERHCGEVGDGHEQRRADEKLTAELESQAHLASPSSRASSSSRDSRSYSPAESRFVSSNAATAVLTEPSKKVRTTCDRAELRTSSAGAVGR